MKNIRKKVSALVLTTMFAMMQVSAAMDTGLGVGNGGAVINNITGANATLTTGDSSATLTFDGNSHVNWNTLNVNSNETLNFNANDGVSGITVLNTVNQGMSKIYGNINTNAGVKQLIISNPNGVLFDGAKFTTAGDAMITAQGAAMNANGTVTYDPSATRAFTPNGQDYVITVKNSDFQVGGDLNFVAPTMNVVQSAFNVKKGNGDVRFTTTNGQDYFVTQASGCNGNCKDTYTETQAMRMEAVKVDGNVVITSNKGIVKTVTGGEINGNLNINSDGSVALNYVDNGKILNVKGDVDVKGNGVLMYARNTKVGGNLNMENGGGFLEVGNVQVGKDMNLTTVAKSENPYGYKHFTHVIGKNKIGGNATINSENNIHIGNYKFEEDRLLNGKLEVGGDLTAHANNGHVMTTIDVDANKIDFASEKLNVLTNDKAVLNAKEYKFKSNGYIGAISDYTDENGNVLKTEDQIISLMENYTYIPKDIKSHAYTNISGGKITQINAPKDAQVYIASSGDVVLTGANAGDINLTAYRKRIDITGPDVHANNINIGPETDYLKLDFEGRDFTTNYTNIRDEKVVTIKPDEKITYELTDGQNGYNQPTLKPGEKTTYLIGPAKTPDPNKPTPPDDDNVRVRNWVPDDPTKPMASTPVAYAADLDEDDPNPCRKNVDGSVTVVRAYPMD